MISSIQRNFVDLICTLCKAIFAYSIERIKLKVLVKFICVTNFHYIVFDNLKETLSLSHY